MNAEEFEQAVDLCNKAMSYKLPEEILGQLPSDVWTMLDANPLHMTTDDALKVVRTIDAGFSVEIPDKPLNISETPSESASPDNQIAPIFTPPTLFGLQPAPDTVQVEILDKLGKILDALDKLNLPEGN